MLQEIVFQVAKRRVATFEPTASSGASSRTSTAAYDEWRKCALEEEFTHSFEADLVRDKDVLDFGCGSGAMSLLMNRLGARSCIGIDLSEKSIETARAKVSGQAIEFRCASDTTTIELKDAAVDRIVCFDVMEHIMDYEAIIGEWLRVLRPGGMVLIHWQPWFHPYGHHGHDYLPVPWVHVFLNHRKRTELCARIVEMPEFNAPWWDYDKNNHRINRFRDAPTSESHAEKSGFLNELTMWRFERLCRTRGFTIARRTLVPFQGPAMVRAVSWGLSRLPLIREFFTANAIYVLAKPN